MRQKNKYTLKETLDDIETWINDSMYYTGYNEDSGVVKVTDLTNYLNELRGRSGIKVEDEE